MSGNSPNKTPTKNSANITHHNYVVVILENLLREFVDERNDSAHGDVTDIHSIAGLRERIGLVKTICHAISRIVSHRILQNEVKLLIPVIGEITETYSQNVCVVTCSRGEIRVGSKYYFVREVDYVDATVRSIRLNDVDCAAVRIKKGQMEVGIRADANLSLKMKMVSID